MSSSMADQGMISGFGKFHTADPDPGNPQKRLTPYVLLRWANICQMVNRPQEGIAKDQAQWLIPSEPSIAASTASKRSAVTSCCCGKTSTTRTAPVNRWTRSPRSLRESSATLTLVYTSRSATTEKQKARLLIPALSGLSGSDWTLYQEVLADKLRDAGIEPDTAALGCGQVLYLPNRGDYYRAVNSRNGYRFDPVTAFADDLAAKRQAIVRGKTEVERRKAAALEKRQALRHDAKASVINAFNENYSVEGILMQHGYDQRGEHFRHPASETGSYSAHVRDGGSIPCPVPTHSLRETQAVVRTTRSAPSAP